nr:zinc finger protein 37-like isoform X2 [Crassostrea gigas]
MGSPAEIYSGYIPGGTGTPSPSSLLYQSLVNIDAEMASQDSIKLPITKTVIKSARIIHKFVIKQKPAQKDHSISSSSTQQGNGDKSSSCDEICGPSLIESAASQENNKSNTETTAMKSDENGFTVIRWEGLTKTKFDDNTCVSKGKVISNITVEKLENVILKQESNKSNTIDPKQNHPVNYQCIPKDRSNDSQETAESEVPNLASRKQPVVVLERIKVEPDLMVSNIPEELGENMQEGCSENIGNINLSEDSVARTLLDVKTEEYSIECSEQGMFLRGVTVPYTSSGVQQKTKQSEDEMLESKIDSEDFVMSKQMEEEIQSVIQTNVEEMLISEQTSKGEGFTYSYPFACGQCNYTAKLQHHLKNHMKTHMSDRPFVCEICGKGFKHAHHLSGHKRTHSRERPYSCEHCGRGFTQISNMLRHQRTHQGLTERDQHKCYKCGKSFFTAYSLRRHSEMHENLKKKVKTIKNIKKKKLTYNPTVDDHQRKFECNMCGRKFTRKEHVMRHMLTHTGESMYTCEVCGKGFGSKKALQKHINIHTGDDIEVDEDDTGSSSSSDSSGEDDMEDC